MIAQQSHNFRITITTITIDNLNNMPETKIAFITNKINYRKACILDMYITRIRKINSD